MRTLVEVQGRLTPVASKSQIMYAFPVQAGLDGLTVKFSYSPKLLEDKRVALELIRTAAPQYMEEPQLGSYMERWEQALPLQNLLTLSLDDPHRFRGAAHRHSPEQAHRIGFGEASPGFLPGPMVPGVWRITVSVHAIVTENCTYELRVSGWKEGTGDGLA
ncbi:hypothetical protein [Paenibacillus piri]|uniref:Uncharacterized protein n=1 Tax=Paenibacillus piri TaxID=2547395 RepID=A0A4R5KU31_9BACL|nr:hypothetical protein [Paenibacillus piri]TDF98598.1 hypothetical protein E1757_08620 [Paenibacillus piri]